MSEPWHRLAVGGLWDEIGRLQFEFLVAEGLRPHHYLLDVGCGSLRGGVHFISYLGAGHYYGIDKDEELMRAGRDLELGPDVCARKRPTLVRIDNFLFASLGRHFEYALAQSVFTHVDGEAIRRCLGGVAEALCPAGRFYATFFQAEPGGSGSVAHTPAGIVTYPDRDPYHYDFDVFRRAAQHVGLQATNIGDWGHPRGQKMMVFTHVPPL